MATRSAVKPHAARFAPLEAKLEPPRRRPGLVARYSLVDRLRDSAADPIIYVAAPAGYGKTTLMAHWADADERPFAWVSLDVRDNDPVALLTYVALALNRVEPLGGPVFSALSAQKPVVDGVVLPRLGKAVATRSKPFVLVLDDAHVLTSPEALDALVVLTRHLPAGSQLALTARSEPTLPLGKLRAGRRLFELGPADLAFAPDEAEILLRGAGIELEPAEVRLITERTEGWPAGLYLAALSLRAHGSVVAVESFTGDDRIVADYFRDEVLARLSPGLARFLTRTSVLDRLSAPLCDAILEQTGSASKLHKLERSNLFLVPLDRQRVWYRYHTLFAEMLRARLRDAEPGLELELNARASDWYAEHGEPEEAMRHALAAGNVDQAGDLVWANVVRYRGRGRGPVLLRWLSAFTDEQIAGYPPLALAAAWTSLGVESGGIERWTAAAARGSYEGPLSDGTTSLESALALLRATIARDGVTRMGEDAARFTELEAEDSAWWPRACYMEGAAARLSGDTELARPRLEEGERLAAAFGLVTVRAMCLAQLAALAIAEESWSYAAELAKQATDELLRAGLVGIVTVAPVYTISALVHAHQGEVETARAEIRHSRTLIEEDSEVAAWLAVDCRLTLARASLLLADVAAARTLLGEARRIAATAPDLGLLDGALEELTATAAAYSAAGHEGASTLTGAEVRLLHLLPTHLTFGEIGERVHLSRNTVKSQAVSMYRKLDVSSRSDAVERANELGLL
jgi:LuxR family transcriptional regulator, maltose regulon positive regulatory protein